MVNQHSPRRCSCNRNKPGAQRDEMDNWKTYPMAVVDAGIVLKLTWVEGDEKLQNFTGCTSTNCGFQTRDGAPGQFVLRRFTAPVYCVVNKCWACKKNNRSLELFLKTTILSKFILRPQNNAITNFNTEKYNRI